MSGFLIVNKEKTVYNNILYFSVKYTSTLSYNYKFDISTKSVFEIDTNTTFNVS